MDESTLSPVLIVRVPIILTEIATLKTRALSAREHIISPSASHANGGGERNKNNNDGQVTFKLSLKFWQVEDINEVDTTFNIGKFSEKIDFDGERYSVPLPWKQDHKQIPDNFQNSRNRLTSVFRQLKAKPELLQQYDDIIKQLKRDGIIEQVTEPPPPPVQVHYLPHHYVLKEDKSTTKIRIVYDASSNSPSLNDCLEKGPSLGMNASQFLLAASIIKHLEKYQSADPDFVLAFLENLYVDDSIGEGDTSDQVFTFYQKAKARLKKAGLILRKLRSNSSTLQAQISKFEIEDPAPPDEKILGITWDTANDEMEIDLSRKKQEFFQKLCTTVNDWDTEVSEELKDEWNSLIELFSISLKYRLQRYYFANYPLSDLKDITLHGFCDASKRSYAAVVYIIGTLSSGRSVGRIVCSKTKVSPLNELPIPRLELLSCLLLSSLIACISQSLGSAVPVALKFCWSDSIDALCWGFNEDQLQWPEEPNNNKIKITSVNPGTVDPGQSVKDQRPNSVPNKFSTLHSVLSHQNLDTVKNVCSTKPVLSDECPLICKRTVDLEDHLQDQRPSLRQRTEDVGVRPQGQQSYFSGSITNSRTLPIEELVNSTSVNLRRIFDVKRFSSMHKLLRVTAYVIKFIDCLKSPINGNVSKQTLLSTEDLEHAELLWVKTCQKDLTSRLNQLNNTLGLFIDKDDIIRCKGRLLHANLPYDSKYPILLPGDSYLSTLIIRRVHQQTFHACVKHTLSLGRILGTFGSIC
ncbi:uncharacterized protein LOC130621287 [Hydractinia symbiolongicarpus]|uniref:uncharacterized protein LOC130621287 n=1 Tax=Hydractinia symbiolongicarpus TaxID=13093 RepID=UPI00255173DB|nr:uncharacterized protein LOC130621287 [Hydractinia symbiolongicarpus]